MDKAILEKILDCFLLFTIRVTPSEMYNFSFISSGNLETRRIVQIELFRFLADSLQSR